MRGRGGREGGREGGRRQLFHTLIYSVTPQKTAVMFSNC